MQWKNAKKIQSGLTDTTEDELKTGVHTSSKGTKQALGVWWRGYKPWWYHWPNRHSGNKTLQGLVVNYQQQKLLVIMLWLGKVNQEPCYVWIVQKVMAEQNETERSCYVQLRETPWTAYWSALGQFLFVCGVWACIGRKRQRSDSFSELSEQEGMSAALQGRECRGLQANVDKQNTQQITSFDQPTRFSFCFLHSSLLLLPLHGHVVQKDCAQNNRKWKQWKFIKFPGVTFLLVFFFFFFTFDCTQGSNFLQDCEVCVPESTKPGSNGKVCQ